MNNRIIGYCKAMAMLTKEYNKRFPNVEGIIDIVEAHSDKLFEMQLENPKFKGYCPYFTKMKKKCNKRNYRKKNPLLL